MNYCFANDVLCFLGQITSPFGAFSPHIPSHLPYINQSPSFFFLSFFFFEQGKSLSTESDRHGRGRVGRDLKTHLVPAHEMGTTPVPIPGWPQPHPAGPWVLPEMGHPHFLGAARASPPS